MYADDIALLAEDTASLKAAIELLDAVFSDWGLTVSTSKTKNLVIGRDSDTQAAYLDISRLINCAVTVLRWYPSSST